MMDPKLLNNIRKLLDIEALKSKLVEYFHNKEVRPNMLLYPPLLQDVGENIPEVASKIEIVPYMEELDPTTGFMKIGWNLFVLGTNKKFLGYTSHDSVENLQNPIESTDAMRTSIRYTTPNEVIDFIVSTLDRYSDEEGMAEPAKGSAPGTYASKLPVANAYYQENKSLGRRL